MSYTSFTFILFTLLTIIIYYLFPLKKYQWTVLLIASLVFYFWFSIKYAVFILLTCVTIYIAGIWIDRIRSNTKQTVKANKETWSKEERSAFKRKGERKTLAILIITLIINFGILGILKYLNPWASGLLGSLLGVTDENGVVSILMPLGISFYTFQSTGYLIDVYRENVEPERNPLKFLLFISYFPQILQGPIGQYEKLQNQLMAEHRPEWDRFKLGGELILWGVFKKLVIADRAVVAISAFQEDPGQYGGTATLIVAILYALQLYADFSGGIDISRGISQVLGIDLAQNFRRPYFATTINDYWRRWHITLGEWMKNYVFYSLAVSGPFLKLGRKVNKALPTAIASFIVFILVGIWHGSNSKYLAFGIWNGVLVALSVMLTPGLEAISKSLRIKVDSMAFRLFRMVRTFILVLIGYYFDIAPSFRGAMVMLKKTVVEQSMSGLAEQVKALGLHMKDYKILLLAGLILLFMSIRQEQENLDTPGELISKRNPAIQWIAIFLLFALTVVLGWYGPGYDPAEFVYMQF